MKTVQQLLNEPGTSLVSAKLPRWMTDPVEYNKTMEFYARQQLAQALAARDHERAGVLVRVADKAHKRMRYYRRFFRIQNRAK